jgi:hypothetical protein
MDRELPHPHRPRHAELLVERQRLLLHGRGGRDDLVGRPGLERVRHGPVPIGPGRRVTERVGIEPGIGRHREDLARVRIHHDHGATSSPLGRDGFGQRRLYLELELAVERGEDGRPLYRRLLDVDAAGDRLPVRVELGRPLARRARQNVLIPELESGETVPVDPDEPDDLRGECARGVRALRRVEEADAGQPEGPDLVGDLGLDLASQVDERGLRGQLLDQVRDPDAEQRREARGRRPRVGDVARVHVEVEGGRREREPISATIEDFPSLGR